MPPRRKALASVPPGMLDKLTSRLQNASWTARRSGGGRARLRRRRRGWASARSPSRSGSRCPAAPSRSGVFDMMEILGREETLARLERLRAAGPERGLSAGSPRASDAPTTPWQPQPAGAEQKGMTHDQPGPPHRQARHRRQDRSSCRSTRAPSAPTSSTSAGLYCRRRRLHLRPGLHLDRLLRERDHLHRRRQGRAALPRLPDRAARREVDTSSRSPTCCSTASCRPRRSSRTSSAA